MATNKCESDFLCFEKFGRLGDHLGERVMTVTVHKTLLNVTSFYDVVMSFVREACYQDVGCFSSLVFSLFSFETAITIVKKPCVNEV